MRAASVFAFALVCLLRRHPRRRVCLAPVLVLALATVLAGPLLAQQGTTKVLAPAGSLDGQAGALRLATYGSRALYLLDQAALGRAAGVEGVRVLPDADRLLIEAAPFDTQRERPQVPAGLRALDFEGPALHVVQFVGPVQQAWLDDLRSEGIQPIHAVARHGYLVLADGAARRALQLRASGRGASGDPLQYVGAWEPFWKLGASLRARSRGKGSSSSGTILVTVQMVRHAGRAASENRISALATRVVSTWQPILAFQNALVEIDAAIAVEIARLPDVTYVGERGERTMDDELQGQIMAGQLTADGAQPTGPGYAAYLTSLGMSTDPLAYPLVDITDDGIGTGDVDSGDPTLYEFGDASNPSRLSYVQNCTGAANGGSLGGHGHINTSIVGSFDDRLGFPYQDLDGYQRGLGISPFGRVSGTRVFGPSFDLTGCGGTDVGLIRAIQDAGADISTNSWGCSGCAGSYDESSQAWDVGTRDADLTEAGNQELTFIFSAGNSGPVAATIGSPGNAKNVITVGASESYRPADDDGPWTDGCNIGPGGADSAMDVIGFSSRGPAPGNRTKPEVIAPGTHIQGTASTNSGFNGNGVCDQYRPGDQTVFAASSGTSHSAPAIAGLTSLVHHWVDSRLERLGDSTHALSPALMKAYLMAHPAYLTGVDAGDDLPSNNQGYGMPTHQLLFDDAARVLLDQTVVFDAVGEEWTWQGSAADPARPVRIVMVYTDQAGAIGTSPQVNDLDLEVRADNVIYRGNNMSGAVSVRGGVFDATNNYEAVFLASGVGAIEITVGAVDIAGDGVPNTGDETDQDFALVCYNCAAEPTFALEVTPRELAICAPEDASFNVQVASILGFSDAVDLDSSGVPAGVSAVFSSSSVIPGDSATLTLSGTGAAESGRYDLVVTGTSGSQSRTAHVALDLFDTSPGSVVLEAPLDDAALVDSPVTFSWSAPPGGGTATLEVATDSSFQDLVAEVTEITGSTYTAASLESGTRYYWRVRHRNACGTADWSETRTFETTPLPGDCPAGSEKTTFFLDDFETDVSGWETDGPGATWSVEPGRAHSGSRAFHAANVSTVSDQRLVTPAVTLPTGMTSLSFVFWQYQAMESAGSQSCFDGGVVEVSTDGGDSWSAVDNEIILTQAYDGPLAGSHGNPLGGRDAWCGDPRDWMRSVIALDEFAGSSVQLRFRLATDASIGREGWFVDDVEVRGCRVTDPHIESLFEDDFESGNASSWSSETP